jgi:hypothetical protein
MGGNGKGIGGRGKGEEGDGTADVNELGRSPASRRRAAARNPRVVCAKRARAIDSGHSSVLASGERRGLDHGRGQSRPGRDLERGALHATLWEDGRIPTLGTLAAATACRSGVTGGLGVGSSPAADATTHVSSANGLMERPRALAGGWEPGRRPSAGGHDRSGSDPSQNGGPAQYAALWQTRQASTAVWENASGHTSGSSAQRTNRPWQR